MATLTITHTVRSATITDPRNFTATTTKQVSGGTVVDRLVGAAWVQVYDNNTAGDPNHLFLMNTGAEDAIIRLSYGAGNYARLTLPAGAAMQSIVRRKRGTDRETTVSDSSKWCMVALREEATPSLRGRPDARQPSLRGHPHERVPRKPCPASERFRADLAGVGAVQRLSAVAVAQAARLTIAITNH